MTRELTPDLCIIGGGSAGLAIAAGAQQMGADCVLIERDRMGGDCLNYGCVPSKALLAAGRSAQLNELARKYGVHYEAPRVDFQGVHDHVHGVIAGIAPHDSVERFEGLGVTVLNEHARFTDARTVEAGEARVRARRFVIATGSGPMVPPIPGLEQVPYLTNETVFELTERPGHLIVVGGGPIGSEMSQAFANLGARVSLVDMARVLPNDDSGAAEVVRTQLQADGVEIHEQVKVAGVAKAADGGVEVTLEGEAGQRTVAGSHILVAAGRRTNLDGLDLDAAGIEHAKGQLTVDDRLRTTNTRVFAAGDAAGSYQFTHAAAYHAGVIIKNALFRLPAKADHSALPWVTYTHPELAHVGLNEAKARERHGDTIRVLQAPFADNDRARTERRTDGFVKAVTTQKGKVLGCTIVGESAGELIYPWVLAVQQKQKVGPIAQMIAPYPTLGEASKSAAGQFYTPKLFSARTRKLVRFLAKLG